MPFHVYSLYDFDVRFRSFITRSDKFLQLILLNTITESMNRTTIPEAAQLLQAMMTLPKSDQETIYEGLSYTSAQIEQIEFYLLKLENSVSIFGKVLKKQICLDTDLSLCQINNLIRSQLIPSKLTIIDHVVVESSTPHPASDSSSSSSNGSSIGHVWKTTDLSFDGIFN